MPLMGNASISLSGGMHITITFSFVQGWWQPEYINTNIHKYKNILRGKYSLNLEIPEAGGHALVSATGCLPWQETTQLTTQPTICIQPEVTYMEIPKHKCRNNFVQIHIEILTQIHGRNMNTNKVTNAKRKGHGSTLLVVGALLPSPFLWILTKIQTQTQIQQIDNAQIMSQTQIQKGSTLLVVGALLPSPFLWVLTKTQTQTNTQKKS